ncbi:hypothetical protein N6L24_03010 [Cognatishimia sp. SS12]|uniref:hypothetical protein n=1 Tax=Cognatishimia sp. SS12 TaxID=2979465 RepID=UPI00233055EA|nr:hypothetical protein [Cognatishimia sp. SS12]MDC0737238.1 hypothetical protein [Cognatishimia sp. SS12]
MHKPIGVLLVSTLVLTSCGTVRDSRLNPFNWFGRAERVETVDAEEINPLIPRKRDSIFDREEVAYPGVPVANITELRVERVSGGALIRAKGIAATQGAFEALLEPENDDELPVDGVLTYRLLAIQPAGFRQGTPQSRELNIARFRTLQDLDGVRVIRVVGAQNALQVRR